MKTFEDSCTLIDYRAEQIDKVFKEEFLSVAKNAKVFKQYVLFFIYYSGHGLISGGDTYGIAVDESLINLDSYVTQLSANTNTFTIAFYDCCRFPELQKN